MVLNLPEPKEELQTVESQEGIPEPGRAVRGRWFVCAADP